MTEKSEDQVIWYCPIHKKVDCEIGFDCIEYIPHSKYLALKSDLAKAVGALNAMDKKLIEHQNSVVSSCDETASQHSDGIYFGMTQSIKLSRTLIKEALGKIGGENAK